MILAAGRGERMRPLTDVMPKPLLKAGGQAIIEYQLRNLACAGFSNIIINHAYLGEMIENTLGNGERYDVNIHYSPEIVVLDTAGGIANALPLLVDEPSNLPFLVVNGDIYCSINYAILISTMNAMQLDNQRLAHLVLVQNPSHHSEGDFSLHGDQVVLTGDHKLTFSGIGIYQPQLFNTVRPGSPVKLVSLLQQVIREKKVSGEFFPGQWMDVGTPERLALLDKQLRCQPRY